MCLSSLLVLYHMLLMFSTLTAFYSLFVQSSYLNDRKVERIASNKTKYINDTANLQQRVLFGNPYQVSLTSQSSLKPELSKSKNLHFQTENQIASKEYNSQQKKLLQSPQKHFFSTSTLLFDKDSNEGNYMIVGCGCGVGFECWMVNNLYYILLMEGEVVKGSVISLQNGEPSCQKRRRRKIVKSESSQTERQLYYPDLYEYKKLHLDYEQRRVAHGGWTLQENKIYLQFLEKYSRDFSSEEQRRKTIVFNRLSKKLHKRTPDQCRSHHQKLQNRFKNNIEEIITFVKGKIKRKQSYPLEKEEGKDAILARTGELDYEDEGGIVIEFAHLLDW